MKLVICLIFVFQLGVFATGKAQKVNISVKNASLREVFSELNKQTNYRFLYNEESIKNTSPVTFQVKNVDIRTALNKALGRANLTFNMRGETITIVNKAEADKTIRKVDIEVRGSVKDSADMQTMPGVSVFVKDKPSIGTTTDINGKYILSVPDGATLVFRYVGYRQQEIQVNGRELVDAVLTIDNANLTEVVVIGYGSQKKESVVSSISSVKGEELKFPTRNLSNNLAGQVSGLIAIQRSGEPGYDNSTFWIRGISTFAGGTNPLVLVDGVPRKINDVEPEEIETFSILKDAAATAVYGAEGANGVVLITSKRGSNLKPVIAFRTEHSLSKPTRVPEFVGSADYLTLFNEALKNDGLAPIYSEELISKYRDGVDSDLYPNTNWIEEMMRDNTTNHRYTLNVRGGSERAKYFVSGAYFDESGIFKNDPAERYETNIGVKRYNLRSNVDLEVSKTTTVSVDLAGQYLLTNYPGTGTATIFRQMLLTPPYVFPAVYSDGTLATFEKERDNNMRNPYNMLMNSGYAKEWRSSIQSNVRLAQKLDVITQGLLLKGNVSYDYDGNFYSARSYNPSRYFAKGRDEAGKLIFSKTFSGTPDLGNPTSTSDAVKNIYIETSLNYNRSFDKHEVGAMALYMQKESQLNSNALAFRKQGLVGRLTYAYGNRYFIEGNFGYTGSEAFADGYRFGFFPAVGLSYIVSNEGFYPEVLKDVLSTVKFRASMGRTGNDNTGTERFLYRPTFGMGGPGFSQGITNGGAANGYGNSITEGRFEAPYLSWEIENKKNIGVNLGLFNSQVEIVADYFSNERTGILLQRRTVPAAAGFRTAPWQNYGKVKNWGFDASIDARHQVNDFRISAKGTFTFARNKITEYDELPQPHSWMNFTGTRVSENSIFIADGLYTEQDFDITENANGTKTYKLKSGFPTPTLGGMIGPGDIKYQDLNMDGKIDAFDRKRGVGDPFNPEIVYGFGLNVDYKGFYVSTFFQGTANTSVILGGNTPEGWYPFAWGVDQSNYRTFALDRWTPENPRQDALMPRLHSSGTNSANNNAASTFWMRDGSFLRLKNVEIGYNLPKSFLSKIKTQSARVYAMGHNLAVWDDINFWDPETGNVNAGNNYPLPAIYTVGLEVKF